MPYTIEGLDSTLKALKQVTPDIYKDMQTEIKPALQHIVKDARTFLPEQIPGLRNFMDHGTVHKSRTSRVRGFPTYSLALAKRGIGYSTSRQKANRNGWSSIFTIFNKSASAAIIETAGRKNPHGSAKSKSNNPNAGAYFIARIQAAAGKFYRVGTGQSQEGRIIYHAVSNDNGMARTAIINAVNKATVRFEGRIAPWLK
jgi:hypothetical protein